MIKANELRIGNYYTIDGSIYRVSQVTKDFFNGDLIKEAQGMHTNGGRRNPIVITNKVLEECGFVLHSESPYWQVFTLHDGFYISIWINDTPLAGFEEKGVGYYGENYIRIEYLHQLQNLYFILTGKELEHKP